MSRSFIIDDTCTFYANAHTPSTGAAVDADAVPGYRIYEDETGTPILTGTMALLDDANTTGFYSEQITLSAANGFENGKSYCIRVTIVVGGVTGVQTETIQIGARVDARLIAGQVITAAAGVTFPSSVASPTNITAGTIATVTNLTNAPTNGDFTAAMKAATLARVTLVDTATVTTTATNLTNAPTAGDLTAAMKASVNTEADTALNDYDGPTNAELTTALAAADDAILAQVALVKAKTDLLPGSPAAVGSAMTLTSEERDAIAAALLDLANAIEVGLTLRQAHRLQAAAAAGKLSGAATNTVAIRNAVADSKDRITATVDSDGNRSAITTDVT